MGVHRRHRMALALAFLTMFVLAAPAAAQITLEPIASGQNRTGEVNLIDLAPSFAYNSAGESVTLQILAVSDGFVPALRVLGPDGAVVQDVRNAAGASVINATLDLAEPGVYVFQVQGVGGTTGQFLITVQGSIPEQPATPLVVGLAVPGSVSAADSRQVYAVDALPDQPLWLSVISDSPSGGPSVVLRDAATGQIVGSGSLDLIGIRFLLRPGASRYRLEVEHGGSAAAEAYTVELTTPETATPAPTEVPPGATPTASGVTPTVSGECLATPGQADRVNVRFGPGLDAGVQGVLTRGQVAPVVGRLGDNSWYQIVTGGQVGWVAAFVVTLEGERCASVPVVSVPAAGASIEGDHRLASVVERQSGARVA